MKTKKRQKLCYSCEGEVDLDVIVCPFCAADLREEKPELHRSQYDPTLSVKNLNTQQSLYPPHYAPRGQEEEQPVLKEPHHEEAEMVRPVQEEEPKSVFGPTILLTLGAQLLLLGIFMLIFSKEGVMTLKWDARLWFFYILASVPLILFGAKSLNKV